MALIVGQQVVLITTRHGTGSNNPAVGFHEQPVIGRIDEIGDLGYNFNVHVQWDNGKANSYNEEDLLVVDKLRKTGSPRALVVGDKVALKSLYYPVDERNPLFGTEYYTPGTIIKINNNNSVRVQWSALHSNFYVRDDLDLLNENYRSIW